MAVVLQTLVDSDFEHVVKVTTTGTTTAGSIADASELSGAATDPRMSISGIERTKTTISRLHTSNPVSSTIY